MTSLSSSEVRSMLDLIDVKPGVKFSLGVLRDILPDVESVLFFGKVYGLDYRQLSSLMHQVIKSDLADELFRGDHSTELQDYIVDELVPHVPAKYQAKDPSFDPTVPTGEILPELWKQLEVEVAASIKAVAEKLESIVGLLPGKQGKMVFQSMMKLNAKRPTMGDYRAKITHQRQQRNLVILDVSGSMTASTIHRIVDDVVALSYEANACMAVVSDTCTFWEAGGYDSASVLAACEFSGTHYEQLSSLFDGQDWGVVITVADYDSSVDARSTLALCSGHIDTLLDISLVNRPTFLAECVGQLADEVRPLLIAKTSQVLAY